MKQIAALATHEKFWSVLALIAWGIVALIVMVLVVSSIGAALVSSSHFPTICTFCKYAPGRVERPELPEGKSWFTGYLLYICILCIIFVLCHLVVAAALVWRKADDRMALFAAFLLTLLAVAFCTRLPTLPSFWKAPDSQVMDLGITCLFLFFCLFPLGRLTPWWSLCLGAIAVCWGILALLKDSPLYLLAHLRDLPLNLFGHSTNLATMAEYGLLAALAFLQIYRYQRVSDPTLRRQTRWVVFGMCSAVSLYLLLQIYDSLPVFQSIPPLLNLITDQTLFFLVLLLIPLSIGIAILRSRLWNIDLIIHRTLVYGTLSACVVGLYVLVVGGIGTMVQGQGNILISLLATGLIAVLFHPLRERLQRAVNYLVYGERNDPYQVLSQLDRRLETALALDTILSTMVETVAQTFKLPYAAIILKQGNHMDLGAAYGQINPEEKLLHFALTYQGETLGELIVSGGKPGEIFSATDQRLLKDLARHAGTAVYAVRLHTAIQRSREQLVTTREEERRRLRRDLHDGLGPQLASLMLVLTTVRKMIRTNPDAAEQTLVEATTHLQEAIRDIRRLVYGLRPPALDELGLLATLQEDLQLFQASGIACQLTAPPSLPPLPAAVEVACYRIVREALTNVLNHAQARQCSVRIEVGETIDLEVTDNGRGFQPGWKPGIGLTSLRERAQELGGTCDIGSLPGGGTRVSAHLPWKQTEQAESLQRKELWHGAYSPGNRR